MVRSQASVVFQGTLALSGDVFGRHTSGCRRPPGGRRAGCSRTPAAPRSEDPVRARPFLLFPSWLCGTRFASPVPARARQRQRGCLPVEPVSRAWRPGVFPVPWATLAPSGGGEPLLPAAAGPLVASHLPMLSAGSTAALALTCTGGPAVAQPLLRRRRFPARGDGDRGRPRTAQRQAGPSGRRAGAPTHVEPAPDAEGGQQGGRVKRSGRLGSAPAERRGAGEGGGLVLGDGGRHCRPCPPSAPRGGGLTSSP